MAFWKHRTGQSMTEYTLIGALVALVAFGALGLLGNSISGAMNGILGSGGGNSSSNKSPSSSQQALTATQVSDGTQSQSVASMVSGSESSQNNAQTVVTTGSNGDLLAFQNNISALKAIYEEEEDTEFKILLAQLLQKFARRKTIVSSGGSRVEELEDIGENEYTLGDISTISQRALPGLDGSITEIQGSAQFARLSLADQQRLTRVMQELQTQAQYFVNQADR